MLLAIVIKDVILWTCVCVFIATSLITLLALIKVIKLAEEIYLRRLFYALVLEIVAISVWGFADVIKGGENHKNYVKITNPAKWPWNPGPAQVSRKVFINGIFFKEKDNYVLRPQVFFNQKEYKCAPMTFENETFTTSVDIPGDTSGNLTVNVGLYEDNSDKEKSSKPLKNDEVVTPINQQ